MEGQGELVEPIIGVSFEFLRDLGDLGGKELNGRTASKISWSQARRSPLEVIHFRPGGHCVGGSVNLRIDQAG